MRSNYFNSKCLKMRNAENARSIAVRLFDCSRDWLSLRSGNLFKKSISLLTAWSFLFAQAAGAAEFTLTKNMNLRVAESDSSASRLGVLKKGSVVEIPDAYVVRDQSGKMDFDKTLVNWLQKSEDAGPAQEDLSKQFLLSEKSSEKHHFFPIKVVKAAKGSSVASSSLKNNSATFYMALEHMKVAGSKIETKQDLQIQGPPASQGELVAKMAPAPEARLEANTDHKPCTTCKAQAPEGVLAKLSKLAFARADAADRNGYRRNLRARTSDFSHVEENMKRTCGFSVKDFAKKIEQMRGDSVLQTEDFLAILTQESDGICYPAGTIGGRSINSGLFQINRRYVKKYRACTSHQIATLKTMTFDAMETSPAVQCLENPIVNLKEAIRTAKEKRDALLADGRGFDGDQISKEDVKRLTLAAYNGGQRWILQAKAELEAFNKAHGTSYDSHDWQNIRVSILFGYLKHSDGVVKRGTHRTSSAAHNLAYVENLVGGGPAQGEPSLAERWARVLNKSKLAVVELWKDLALQS